jgi:hypothetical protein
MRALELIALLVSPLVFSVVAADARRWQSHGAGRDAVIRRAAVRRRR